MDKLSEILETIQRAFSEYFGGETREVRELVNHFAEVQRVYQSVLENSAKRGPQSEGTSGEVKSSVQEIISDSGKSYGIGVYLDSDLLTKLSETERIQMVKEYVREIGGTNIFAYDASKNAVSILIAKPSQKFTNKTGKRIPVNKDLTSFLDNKVKQEAIVLIDELASSGNYATASMPKYPHGWLDNNGNNAWDYWKVYIQEKNKTVWEATLNIANTANGEKILYDIYPIKMVEQSGTSDTSTTNNIISHTDGKVNKKFSVSRKQRATEDTLDSDSGSVVEYSQDVTNEIVTDTTQMHPDDTRQLDNVVMQKQVELKNKGKRYTGVQFAYTNDYFVVFDSRQLGEYDFVMAIWVDGNEDLINAIRKGDGEKHVDRSSRVPSEMFADFRHRRGRDYRNYNSGKKTGTYRGDDRLFGETPRSNTRRITDATQTNSAGRARVEYNFEDEQDGVKFSVSRKRRATEDTLDSDSGSVVEYNQQNLSESGEKDYEPRTIGRGINNLSEGNRHQGRGNTGDFGDVSSWDSENESQAKRPIRYEGMRDGGKVSSYGGVERFAQSSESPNETSGQEADGRRFLEAVERQDETTARRLLNEQAERKGFTPATVYRGQMKNAVDTTFQTQGAMPISY